MAEYRVRPATMGDLSAVSGIEEETFDTNAYPPFFFRQAYDVFGDLFCVAENDTGEIVGYALGSLQSGSSEGWILSLAVKKEYRRRGFAMKLMKKVLHILSNRGAEYVYLTVEPGNRVAIKTYRSLGFHEIRTTADYFGPGESRTTMKVDFKHAL